MANELKMAIVESILQLRALHWSARRIARHLHIDRGTVGKHLKRAGTVPKPAIPPAGSEVAKPATHPPSPGTGEAGSDSADSAAQTATSEPAISPTGSPSENSGLVLNTIDLQGSGDDLTGNAITLTGGLTSEDISNKYELDTNLSGSVTIDDQAGDLNLNAVLSGSGSLIVDGSGQLTPDDPATYTGGTTLVAGTTIDDAGVTDLLGTGTVNIGAASSPSAATAKGPTHDPASGSLFPGVTFMSLAGSGATIPNNINFCTPIGLMAKGSFTFTGSVTVSNNVTAPISTSAATDVLTMSGPVIGGSGTLNVLGPRLVTISNNIQSTVALTSVPRLWRIWSGNQWGIGPSPFLCLFAFWRPYSIAPWYEAVS